MSTQPTVERREQYEKHAEFLVECTCLGREAEEAGAGPQVANLAKLSKHVAAGRITEAAKVRDAIAKAKADAISARRENRTLKLLIAAGFAAQAVTR